MESPLHQLMRRAWTRVAIKLPADASAMRCKSYRAERGMGSDVTDTIDEVHETGVRHTATAVPTLLSW